MASVADPPTVIGEADSSVRGGGGGGGAAGITIFGCLKSPPKRFLKRSLKKLMAHYLL
jgi:hypothetical protein